MPSDDMQAKFQRALFRYGFVRGQRLRTSKEEQASFETPDNRIARDLQWDIKNVSQLRLLWLS